MIEIKLTKKEYRDLLDIVYLGDWMINAIRTDDKLEKYDKMAQHLYSYARDAGLENLIEFNEEFNKFFPTKKFEENPELQRFMEDYDDENFWDELVYRLARHDFIKEYGENAVRKMSWEERIEKEHPFIEKYEEEFERDGIENLRIEE